MKQLSLGASSKNTLSDKELKSAPPDPVERYAWAITACIKKVGGCTIEDSEEYDNLIEQSCRAAGIEMQAASAAKKANTKKDQSSCESEISLCVRGEKKCGAGFVSCKSDTDFDRVFSECVIASAGCGDFSAGIRAPLLSARDSSVKNAAALLATIVASHKAARESQVADARKSCEKNNSRDECVKKVCENNMRNKCAAGFAAEVSMATLLCKFHDTACGKLK
jgi:hypothetical protein